MVDSLVMDFRRAWTSSFLSSSVRMLIGWRSSVVGIFLFYVNFRSIFWIFLFLTNLFVLFSSLEKNQIINFT